MQIIPMRELKNTVEIERRCAEENGPVFVTKNGYGRLVVMDIDYYERTMQEMEELKLVMEGLKDERKAAWWMGRRRWQKSGGNMDCEYHFALTQRAKQDVRQNVGYIRNELGNEKAAGMLMNELDKCIERLCIFPESGKLVFDEYLPGIHVRRKIVGKYILFYQVLKEEKVIRILRIVYGRRDMDEVLKHINS